MPRITIAEFEALIERDQLFARDFGFRVESLERGTARVRPAYMDNMLRPGGTVAGPVLMTPADFTIYAVTMSIVGKVALAVTTNLNIKFLRRPAPLDIIAQGRSIKAGRRLVVSEVTIYSDGEAEPVAHVTGTYSIPPGMALR